MRHLTILALLIAPTLALSQGATNDYIFSQKPITGPLVPRPVTPSVGKLLGWPSNINTPAAITLGSGLSLSGSTLSATGSGGTWGSITGTLGAQTDLQAALDAKLTAATAATTYAPLAHNQAWNTITSTPTTLNGYGITDAITAVTAVNSFQPLDADLTAIAALTTTSTGRSLLAAADAAALRSILSVSDIGVHTFSSQRQILTSPTSSGTSPTSSSISTVLDYLTGSALAAPNGSLIFRGVGGWGLRSIGTNGQVLTSNGTQPVWSDPASSGIGGTVGTTDNAIVRADGTGGSTGQGSPATMTDAGAPTFYDSLTLLKTGSADGTTLEVASDPLNAGIRALFILPPDAGNRIYLGKSGRVPYSIVFNGAINEGFGDIVSTAASYNITAYGGNGVSIAPLNGPLTLTPSTHVQFGANHATTPTAQKIKAHDVTTGTGAALDIRGGNGSVAGGAVTISTSPTTTPTERVRVAANGEIFLNLPTSAGTSGSLWNDGGTVKVAP